MSITSSFTNSDSAQFCQSANYGNAVSQFFNNVGSMPHNKIDCSRLGQIIFKYACKNTEFVLKAIDACIPQINQTFSKFKLTPLHLSVMRGSVPIAAKLLEKQADINATDHNNYTPLHHAAMLGDEAMTSFLLKNNANGSARNSHGGTYKNIQGLLQNFPVLQESEREQFINNFNIFFKATCIHQNVNLAQENVLATNQLLSQWEQKKIDNQMHHSWEEGYFNFKSAPVLLKVDHITVDDSKSSLSIPGNQCGLFAGTAIKVGRIIIEYVGRVESMTLNDQITDYRLDHIDATKVRNEAAMANDGFPNAVLAAIYNVNGMIKRYVLVALEDISQDTEITLDYGSDHKIKISGHKELRPKALNEYFAKFNWDKIYDVLSFDLSKVKFANEKDFEAASKYEKVMYLFSTPKAFLSLMKNGIINDTVINKLKSNKNKFNQLDKKVKGWASFMTLGCYKLYSLLRSLNVRGTEGLVSLNLFAKTTLDHLGEAIDHTDKNESFQVIQARVHKAFYLLINRVKELVKEVGKSTKNETLKDLLSLNEAKIFEKFIKDAESSSLISNEEVAEKYLEKYYKKEFGLVLLALAKKTSRASFFTTLGPNFIPSGK